MDRENRRSVAPAELGSAAAQARLPWTPRARSKRRLRPSWSPARAALSAPRSPPRCARAATISACWRVPRARARISIPADTLCEGDLTDRASLAAALKGVRFLFHAAADYRLWAKDPDEIRRNNVEGTRLIMEEALRAGVERVVYTSSVATLKLKDGAAATEDAPLAESEAIGAYKRSKVAAERLVEAMVLRDRLPAVIVNPSTPIGPRDVKPTPTGRIIVEAASGRMPAFVDTGLNLAHVDDIAAGHLAALERGRIGERYILGGENVLLADMLADIARLVGRRPPTIKLPRTIALSARLRRRDGGSPARRRAVHHPGRPAHVAPSHVLRRFQGAARAWLCLAALSRGPRRCDRMVSRAWASQMIVASPSLPVLIWAYLLLGRGWFWLCRERDDSAAAAAPPDAWPSVVAIVPARDEADMIGRAVGSLLRQDYPGRFSVIVVDDQSTDGTADVASAAAREAHGADRLEDRRRNRAAAAAGPASSAAMRRGLAEVEAGAAAAGIRPLHRRRHRLCAPCALAPGRDRAREGRRSHFADGEAALRKRGRALARAGLRVLLPDALSLRLGERPAARRPPRRPAAACWCRREALHAAGGLEAVRGALIDDCALGALMKAAGADLARPDGERRQPARLFHLRRFPPHGRALGLRRIALFARPPRRRDCGHGARLSRAAAVRGLRARMRRKARARSPGR